MNSKTKICKFQNFLPVKKTLSLLLLDSRSLEIIQLIYDFKSFCFLLFSVTISYSYNVRSYKCTIFLQFFYLCSICFSCFNLKEFVLCIGLDTYCFCKFYCFFNINRINSVISGTDRREGIVDFY